MAQAECLLERFADAEATCRKGMALEQVKGDAKQAAMLRTQLQALRDAGHRTDIEQDRMIVNVEEAQREKAVGNSDFQGKRWGDAVAHFTSALEFDPTDHILWSNRHARACRERARSRRAESLMWIYVVDAGSPRI
jgi:Flp pilus assembly protein TadD